MVSYLKWPEEHGWLEKDYFVSPVIITLKEAKSFRDGFVCNIPENSGLSDLTFKRKA